MRKLIVGYAARRQLNHNESNSTLSPKRYQLLDYEFRRKATFYHSYRFYANEQFFDDLSSTHIDNLEWPAVALDLQAEEVLDLGSHDVHCRAGGEARHQHVREEHTETPQLQQPQHHLQAQGKPQLPHFSTRLNMSQKRTLDIHYQPQKIFLLVHKVSIGKVKLVRFDCLLRTA